MSRSTRDPGRKSRRRVGRGATARCARRQAFWRRFDPAESCDVERTHGHHPDPLEFSPRLLRPVSLDGTGQDVSSKISAPLGAPACPSSTK